MAIKRHRNDDTADPTETERSSRAFVAFLATHSHIGRRRRRRRAPTNNNTSLETYNFHINCCRLRSQCVRLLLTRIRSFVIVTSIRCSVLRVNARVQVSDRTIFWVGEEKAREPPSDEKKERKKAEKKRHTNAEEETKRYCI